MKTSGRETLSPAAESRAFQSMLAGAQMETRHRSLAMVVVPFCWALAAFIFVVAFEYETHLPSRTVRAFMEVGK